MKETNKLKIGMIAPANRLSLLNGKIPLEWQDKGMSS